MDLHLYTPSICLAMLCLLLMIKIYNHPENVSQAFFLNGVRIASLQKWGIFLNFNLFQFAKMSRKTRLYDSGTLYHVILRGNGGQRIFFDDSDSRRFYQSSIGNLQQSGKWQMLSIEMILLSVVECIS
jgi:hypothetical protein